MRRALVVALLLAVPVFAGFECTVEVEPWIDGGDCNYWIDNPSGNYCNTSSELFYCAETDQVVAWDCSTACPSGEVGYCDYDSALGYEWCMCPGWTWAPGYTCDYWSQYDDATCSGDILTYCSETNIIGEISCIDQCASTVGAGAIASCGNQPDTGYNGCVCEITTCDFQPYCNDSLWLVWCDGTSEAWLDCNAQCMSEGYSKGVCMVGAPDACLCG